MENADVKKKVQGIVRSVVLHNVRSVMTGPKTFQISFHMEQEELMALLAFMLEHGYEMDEALKVIEQAKTSQMEFVRSAVARSGQPYSHASSDSTFVYVIFIFMLLGAVALTVAEILPMWALALVALFCLGLIWLIWSPKGSAVNAIWRQSAPPKEKLEKMLQLSDESPLAYAYQHCTARFIALVVAAVLCIAGPIVYTAVDLLGASRYHAAITEYGQPIEMTESTGDKFVLYNADKRQYFTDDYLPAEYRAQTTGDVAGVLKITTEKRKVGTYGSIGDAYRYYVTITLYDCTTGEVFDSAVVRGSEPPETLRVRSTAALFGANGSGSKPTDAQMKDACLRLIREYQASK